jgi:hypothetical protein
VGADARLEAQTIVGEAVEVPPGTRLTAGRVPPG